MDTAYYRECLEELALLERTEHLFARFPESRHPLKVFKEDAAAFVRCVGSTALGLPTEEPEGEEEREARTPEDARFERALQEDPELYDFLNKTRFLLAPRLQSVRNALALHSAAGQQFRIACPSCGIGAVHPDFYRSIERPPASRCSAMFLFLSSAHDVIATIEAFGAVLRAGRDGFLGWLYPCRADPQLIFSFYNIDDYLIDLTSNALEAWWDPLISALNSAARFQPRTGQGQVDFLVLAVNALSGNDAAEVLRTFAVTVLTHHASVVEDKGSGKFWSSEQFRSPTPPAVQFEPYNG